MFSRVYLEITNVCNKSCSFCHGTKRAPRFMSLKEFDTVTDKLIGVTEYLYLHILGEPLCHPELIKFISIASKKGFHTAITTNGSLLEGKGDMLISSDIYKVNISLHSFEDGTQDEYNSYISACVNFADKSSQKGILTVLRLWNNGFDDGKNKDIVSILRRSLSGEWVEGTKGIRIRNRLHLEYGDRFSWPDTNAPFISDNVFCYGLRDHFGILSDGTVVPCCLDSEGSIAIGNILEHDINEILNSPRAKNIFDGFTARKATEKLCKHCGYAQRFK